MSDEWPVDWDDCMVTAGEVNVERIEATDNDRLREFIERTRDSADAVENGGYVNGDHTDGVACGLRWAADELEVVIDDAE